jgi:hypothetical protein
VASNCLCPAYAEFPESATVAHAAPPPAPEIPAAEEPAAEPPILAPEADADAPYDRVREATR